MSNSRPMGFPLWHPGSEVDGAIFDTKKFQLPSFRSSSPVLNPNGPKARLSPDWTSQVWDATEGEMGNPDPQIGSVAFNLKWTRIRNVLKAIDSKIGPSSTHVLNEQEYQDLDKLVKSRLSQFKKSSDYHRQVADIWFNQIRRLLNQLRDTSGATSVPPSMAQINSHLANLITYVNENNIRDVYESWNTRMADYIKSLPVK